MKFLSTVILLFFFSVSIFAQNNIIDSNKSLLKKLELRYKTPCIMVEERRVKKKTIRIDRKIILGLNKVYYDSSNFDIFFLRLKKLGFAGDDRTLLSGGDYDTCIYKKVTNGLLDGYVTIVTKKSTNIIVSKRITIATKRNFICETNELWSYSSIDFMYLDKVVDLIKIPLKVSSTLSALESVQLVMGGNKTE